MPFVTTPPTDEITTAEAADLLGYKDRSSVVRLVLEHRLTPSRKMPGSTGMYLFWRADIQRFADQKAGNAA